MIYDCFTFFNELDVLELRLNTLDQVVDKFVLVEATKTHSNKNKELYFKKNKERFSKFHDKIIHIVVDEYPEVLNSWTIENHQRNCIAEAITNCLPDDLILISDVDEIPRPELIAEQKFNNGVYCFIQDLNFFFLNYKDLKKIYWLGGTRALKYKLIKENQYEEKLIRYNAETFPKYLNKGFTPTKIRLYDNCHYIVNGGWHFSYLGGVDTVITKVEAFAHQELNTKEFLSRDRIENCLNSGDDVFRRPNHRFISVPIDNTYPSYVQNNLEKYDKLIWNNNLLDYNHAYYKKLQLLKIRLKSFLKTKVIMPLLIWMR